MRGSHHAIMKASPVYEEESIAQGKIGEIPDISSDAAKESTIAAGSMPLT
jgi:hypothetical protein